MCRREAAVGTSYYVFVGLCGRRHVCLSSFGQLVRVSTEVLRQWSCMATGGVGIGHACTCSSVGLAVSWAAGGPVVMQPKHTRIMQQGKARSAAVFMASCLDPAVFVGGFLYSICGSAGSSRHRCRVCLCVAAAGVLLRSKVAFGLAVDRSACKAQFAGGTVDVHVAVGAVRKSESFVCGPRPSFMPHNSKRTLLSLVDRMACALSVWLVMSRCCGARKAKPHKTFAGIFH
jgi:hypothetical protein